MEFGIAFLHKGNFGVLEKLKLKKTKEFGINFYIRETLGFLVIKKIEEKEGDSAESGACVRARRGGDFLSPKSRYGGHLVFVLNTVKKKKMVFQIFYY
jgi:hypothetical protein